MVCAPMTFLNNNTTGRILNRFTKDMVVMDQTLPDVAYGDRLWRPSPCPLDYFPLYCGLCGKLLFFRSHSGTFSHFLWFVHEYILARYK